MSKIKILQIINNSSSPNGIANIFSITDYVDRGKFEVSIASTKSSIIEERCRNAGVKHLTVKMTDVLRSKYLKILLSLMDSGKFDIIHSHGHSAGIYARAAKKHMSSLKSVHAFHGIDYANRPNFIRNSFDKTIDQYMTQFTDVTVCETHDEYLTAVKEKIAERSRSEIIPPCIKVSEFAGRKRNDELRKKLGIGPENYVVGNISSFDQNSNQKLIIQAAYFLIRKYPQIKFVFSGTGSFLSQMKDLVRESKIDNEVIFGDRAMSNTDYFSIFDAFVHPFIGRQMPIVILEAMASRLPIICSHSPAILEIIKPNNSALTIRPDDMDDLFQKISALYQSMELSERIAQSAQIESTQFDISEIVPKIADVYEKVLLS